ncbi:cysteine dioxygenase [Rhodovarius crocodyli]|uniref:Cysteine dioxygenase n=2 Tax=Rhodovarius crocodyli TaxID=1979269 RepID=A0A437MGR0_9PROT|nr:cysteine dioxygenase [Rhodovarius crocodyli]
MNMIRPRASLNAMLAAIDEACRTPLEGREVRVADAMAPFLDDPELLADVSCPECPDHYIRHLLHEGEDYGVVALVWRPGQMSPVHAHKSWCAFGMHRGIMTEHYYAPGEPPRLTAAHLRLPGDVSHGPARDDLIHRLANCCSETAVSIHVYGLAYEKFATDLNLILA